MSKIEEIKSLFEETDIENVKKYARPDNSGVKSFLENYAGSLLKYYKSVYEDRDLQNKELEAKIKCWKTILDIAKMFK